MFNLFCFIEATRTLWTLSFDDRNQETIIGGELGVMELFLEMKESSDPQVKKACNGALWNMRKKMVESSRYKDTGKIKKKYD